MFQKQHDEMPKLNIDKHKNFLKVFVDYHNFNPHFIGEVRDGMLKVLSTDNIHLPSKSLGIDRLVLESQSIQYQIISIGYKGKTYLTTRWYFFAHAKTYKLYNGRDLLFLQTILFGLKRAMRWEEYMEHYELAQLDIFDVHKKAGYKDDNNALLRKWEYANNLVEIYENQNYKKVDL